MSRLMIENLEGRDLMSAGAWAGPAPAEPRAAVITELEEFANAAIGLTAPLSAKGSFNVPFTYPEMGATLPSSFAGDAYTNEMGVIERSREVNGIIAVLIGLFGEAQPAAQHELGLTVSTKGSVLGFTPPIGSNKGSLWAEDTLPFMEQDNLYKSGSFLLPYIEQENVFKQIDWVD